MNGEGGFHSLSRAVMALAHSAMQVASRDARSTSNVAAAVTPREDVDLSSAEHVAIVVISDERASTISLFA